MLKCIWTYNQTGTVPLLGAKLLNRNGTSCVFITLLQSPLRALLQGSFRALLQGSFRALLQGTFRALLQSTFRALLQGTFRLLLQGTFRALLQSPSTGHFQGPSTGHFQAPSTGHFQGPSTEPFYRALSEQHWSTQPGSTKSLFCPSMENAQSCILQCLNKMLNQRSSLYLWKEHIIPRFAKFHPFPTLSLLNLPVHMVLDLWTVPTAMILDA